MRKLMKDSNQLSKLSEKNDDQLLMDNQQMVIHGLNEVHMWSNDGGNNWRQGREGTLFRGDQTVRVVYYDQQIVSSSSWRAVSYPGNSLVIHNGALWISQWWAESHEIPGLDSVWLRLRAIPEPIAVFEFTRFTGQEAIDYQEREAQRIQKQKKVIGYFPNWQGYKTDVFPDNPSHEDHPGLLDGQGYDPVNVPMDKLTHVNYAFIVIDENGLPILHDPWADTLNENGQGRNYMGQLARLTEENKVTFLMSVGGWTNSLEGKFDIATATPEKMEAFTDGLIDMILQYDFDGVDIDWEFPENEDQKERFIALIKQLREKLTKIGLESDKYFQLTAAVTANYEKMLYIAPTETYPYLDSVNVMSYDFRGAWDPVTGHHTPLYPRRDDENPKFNVAAAMEEYATVYQVPKNKLMVGIGYYSRGWSGVLEPEVGASATGPAVGEWDDPDELAGFNTWFHMKRKEQDLENVVNWDEESKVPYLYDPRTTEFFTYDNPRSVQYKVDYIFEHDFGGSIIWELSNDTTDYELGSIVADILDEEKWVRPDPVIPETEGLVYSFNQTTSEATVTGYTGSSKDVVIPSVVTHEGTDYTVTRIGNSAFQRKYLTSIKIPDSVTHIERLAFAYNHLTSIEFPNMLTKVGERAFDFNHLTNLEIPDSMTSIGISAFQNNRLTNVKLSSSLTSTGIDAFRNNQLTSIEIPNSVIAIDNGSFSNNQLTSIEIPNSVITIDSRSFSNNQLTSIEIPESVTRVGSSAFRSNRLVNVQIPSSISIIGNGTFENNQLTTIQIPNSVTIIGEASFRNNQLVSIDIPSSVTRTGIAAFQRNSLQLVTVAEGLAEQMKSILENGMRGVTHNTILQEGTTPRYQWNGVNSWIPID